MMIPENNRLKKEIEEIVRLCEEAIPEYGEKASYFEDGVSEEEMMEWEEQNGVQIPESYKEWLRFSANCQIRQTLASFYSPKSFRSEIVPADFVIIGHIIGDGEMLCFSKKDGKFVKYFEGEIDDEFDDFKVMLKEIIRLLKGDSGFSDKTKELFMKIHQKSLEKKKQMETKEF